MIDGATRSLETQFVCERLKRELTEATEEEKIECAQSLLEMFLRERDRSHHYKQASNFWFTTTCIWMGITIALVSGLIQWKY